MGPFQKVGSMGKSAQADAGSLWGDFSFPRSELCGLTSQIRRASALIGANLAEGSAR
jgi:hypothetical protein